MTEPAGVEISPNSRFRVSNSPDEMPGHCIVCGASDNDRQYIDFGMSLDFYGVVYFCTHCFAEASAAAGFLPVQMLDAMRVKLVEPDAYTKVIDEYRGFRDAVRIVLRDCSCHVVIDDSILSLDDSPEDESGSDSDHGDATESEFDGESGSS